MDSRGKSRIISSERIKVSPQRAGDCKETCCTGEAEQPDYSLFCTHPEETEKDKTKNLMMMMIISYY